MMHPDSGRSRCPLAGDALGALAATLVVVSCGGASDAAVTWDGAIRDSAGIEIVENFGTPVWREGEQWEFTEVLRIGTVEGAPEYQFGRITAVAVLSDRRVVVADAMAHHLRFFSADGVYEQTVGTQGQGPGEFGDGFLGILLGPGDTMVVRDPVNGQMHTFAPDGSWMGSFSAQPRDGYRPAGWDYDVATKRLVSSHVPMLLPDQPPGDTFDIVLARDVHGAVLDTVARVPTTQRYARQGDATLRYYYRGKPDYDLCGDGIITGRSDEYRLYWHGPEGTVDRIFSLPWEPRPMTEEDQSIILRRWDGLFQQFQVPLERAAAIRATLRFESTYPAYRRFICGPGTTVLVQHVRPVRDLIGLERKDFSYSPDGLPGALEWDVFDGAGRYLGAAKFPGTDWASGWRNASFVRDATTGIWYMYSAWSDEQDVEYVLAWRLDGQVPE